MGAKEKITEADYEATAERVAMALLNVLRQVTILEARMRGVAPGTDLDHAPAIHGAFTGVILFALEGTSPETAAEVGEWAQELVREGVKAYLADADTIGPVAGAA